MGTIVLLRCDKSCTIKDSDRGERLNQESEKAVEAQ